MTGFREKMTEKSKFIGIVYPLKMSIQTYITKVTERLLN
jgi:hypothetical protein